MKKIPVFKSSKAEAKFWEHEDSTKYIDWNKAVLVSFPNLRPSAKTISLKLPASLLSEIKALAHRGDVPYQSLIKVMLAREVNLWNMAENQPSNG